MLLVSKVPRALETKTKLFGFELGDLLIIFMYLSITNLVFGTTRLKFPVVWIGTAVIAFALHFFKKGKPEQHLQHLAEYYNSAGVFSAAEKDIQYQPYFVRTHE